MLLEIDNKGTVYLINNWIMTGRTRYVETHDMFMREMKEKGIFQAIWISSYDNEVDLFNNNLQYTLFEKQNMKFNGE